MKLENPVRFYLGRDRQVLEERERRREKRSRWKENVRRRKKDPGLVLRQGTTVYDDLCTLTDFIRMEMHLEEGAQTGYAGTQKYIAYKRVFDRLAPILLKARRVRAEFDFVFDEDV